ncbi:MAG: STAS domain-containing protein [Spirochaetales bacterium]|nr:STAS domain-containing protein [Spirochaetales bacterium]
MKVTIRNHTNPDALIIDLDGDFDLYSSYKVKEDIEKLIEQGNHTILFNMEKVKYLDSTGIGVLIRVLLLLKPKNGIMRLFKVHEAPMKVLKLTMLTQMLGVYDTEETALASINKQ